MQLTPEQLALIQARQQPQGAIQQAQGAPALDAKQAMLQKFMALPPALKDKFLATVKGQKK